MIVCLDTNVFVSGIFWKGTPSRIIQLWIDGVLEVVSSPEILAEYESVLKRFKKKMPWEELVGWMDFAKSRSKLITPSAWPTMTCRDLADKKFLTCALEGRASFLITGDDDLLELKGTLPVEILTPREFFSLKTSGVT